MSGLPQSTRSFLCQAGENLNEASFSCMISLLSLSDVVPIPTLTLRIPVFAFCKDDFSISPANSISTDDAGPVKDEIPSEGVVGFLKSQIFQNGYSACADLVNSSHSL